MPGLDDANPGTPNPTNTESTPPKAMKAPAIIERVARRVNDMLVLSQPIPITFEINWGWGNIDSLVL